MTSAAPPRMFACFAEARHLETVGLPHATPTRYRLNSVQPRAGDVGSLDFELGQPWLRVEAPAPFAAPGFRGVTQHVAYTTAPERALLTRISAKEAGDPWAVLIPIRKSAAWWAMAQDERLAMFHGRRQAGESGGSTSGHYTIGARYAERIYRRLYHSRYLTDSGWDFLTYFEFPEAERRTFESLLAELRDVALNPEWGFVEAEVEFWLRRED